MKRKFSGEMHAGRTVWTARIQRAQGAGFWQIVFKIRGMVSRDVYALPPRPTGSETLAQAVASKAESLALQALMAPARGTAPRGIGS